MWNPFKKKREIILAPGESAGIKLLTAWRKDKNEVAIITEKGPIILNEASKFFIEVTAKNADPIKIEVIPDFKKKVLNLVEVIDSNVKKKYTDKDSPKLKFAGVEIVGQRYISFGEQLKNWDENVEGYGKIIKKYKRILAYLIMPISISLVIINLYLFIIKNDIYRYISLILAISSILVSINMWLSYKKYCNHYRQYKELRGKIFELVKEK